MRTTIEENISCRQAAIDLGFGNGVISRWIREKENLKGHAFIGSGNVRPSDLEILKKAMTLFF